MRRLMKSAPSARRAQQGEGEGRALPGSGLDPDASAVQGKDSTSDGEAQPRAPLLPRVRAVDLLELVEDAGLVLRRDAWSGVGHRNQEGAVGDLALDAHLARVGELDRIADQV